MDIKGIIFDLDGTLLDSMGIWETAGRDYLLSMGIQPHEDLRKTLKTMSLLQAAEYVKEKYSLKQNVEEIIKGIIRVVEKFYLNCALPKENVISALSEFQTKGIKMCIATATDRTLAVSALKRCNMLGFFEEIFTCSEVGAGKDRPDIFQKAREFLNTGLHETAVFEDAYHGAKTAKDAGFFVVGVYDPSEDRAEELKSLADRYIMNFSEIKGKIVQTA